MIGVFIQSFKAHFGKTKLPFDNMERTFDLVRLRALSSSVSSTYRLPFFCVKSFALGAHSFILCACPA